MYKFSFSDNRVKSFRAKFGNYLPWNGNYKVLVISKCSQQKGNARSSMAIGLQVSGFFLNDS